jgi:hypothetical protein
LLYINIIEFNASEAFPVNDCWSRFVILLFVDPHCLES